MGQLSFLEEHIYMKLQKPLHSLFKSLKFHQKVEKSIKISKLCNSVKI